MDPQDQNPMGQPSDDQGGQTPAAGDGSVGGDQPQTPSVPDTTPDTTGEGEIAPPPPVPEGPAVDTPGTVDEDTGSQPIA